MSGHQTTCDCFICLLLVSPRARMRARLEERKRLQDAEIARLTDSIRAQNEALYYIPPFTMPRITRGAGMARWRNFAEVDRVCIDRKTDEDSRMEKLCNLPIKNIDGTTTMCELHGPIGVDVTGIDRLRAVTPRKANIGVIDPPTPAEPRRIDIRVTIDGGPVFRLTEGIELCLSVDSLGVLQAEIKSW